MSSVPSPIAQSDDAVKAEVTWLHGRWIKNRFGFSMRSSQVSDCRVDLLVDARHGTRG